jgi:hypothetical protein
VTENKEKQFEEMYLSLRRIAKGYMTPAQIRRESAKGVLSFEEYIEMAYDNIQAEAKNGLHGIRLPKSITYITPSSGPPMGRKKEGVR